MSRPFSPFGEQSCEIERARLKTHYPDYYFKEAPFNETAIDPDTYLIVGRRGSGKTSLANYFIFQKKLKATGIDVDEPAVYSEVLAEIARKLPADRVLTIERLAQVWDYTIWNVVFEELKDQHEEIRKARLLTGGGQRNPSAIVREVLRNLCNKFFGDGQANADIGSKIENLIANPTVVRAKEAVLAICRRRAIIVAIDTLEKYDVDNDSLMLTTAALVQFASNANLHYAYQGLHVKAFIAGEVYPHLAEVMIPNPTKHVRDPLFLHWRPKGLIKLVSWRFSRYLAAEHGQDTDVDWSDFQAVLKRLWYPYFGESINNRRGQPERTFQYILRHTQMRPRQLVIMCNKIAKAAAKSFPSIDSETIVRAVRNCELFLATEVINSFSETYKNVNMILDALNGCDQVFRGNRLDQLAPRTADQWPAGESYSAAGFKKIVTELGVVGRVREREPDTGVIWADFEYFMEGRLVLPHDCECVMHPMFYRKFNVNMNSSSLVYPFPDHPEFRLDDA